jgi:hypothetical protein
MPAPVKPLSSEIRNGHGRGSPHHASPDVLPESGLGIKLTTTRLAWQREAAMRLRRWHRLGIILTLIGGIGLFYYVFTRDDELGEDIYYRQTNECRVAERRGLPADKCYREVERQRAKVIREKWEEAAIVTAAAIVLAWLAAFMSIGLYRWVMAGAPNSRSERNRGSGGKRRSSERIEPKI